MKGCIKYLIRKGWNSVFIGCGSQGAWRGQQDLNGHKIHSLLYWRRTEATSHHQMAKLSAPPPCLPMKGMNCPCTHIRPPSPLVPLIPPSSSAHKHGSCSCPVSSLHLHVWSSAESFHLEAKTLQHPFSWKANQKHCNIPFLKKQTKNIAVSLFLKSKPKTLQYPFS